MKRTTGLPNPLPATITAFNKCQECMPSHFVANSSKDGTRLGEDIKCFTIWERTLPVDFFLQWSGKILWRLFDKRLKYRSNVTLLYHYRG